MDRKIGIVGLETLPAILRGGIEVDGVDIKSWTLSSVSELDRKHGNVDT